MSSTFIVGCARSGTTSLLKAIRLSKQAIGLVEPAPNLNIESREMLEGRLSDPYKPLAEHVAPRVAKGLSKRCHYVEKQLALVPFIPQLDRLFRCRFIIPIRDGRHVVRSLINWHNQMFPLIYQECKERGQLSERAEKVLAEQVGIDPYDYSLPRPQHDDPWRDCWKDFTRLEMAAWYWATINQLTLKLAYKIDPERVLVIDYTKPTIETIRRVYEFIGLTDFDEEAVSAILEKRVNSLEDRISESGSFPAWENWTALQKQRFSEITHDAMRLLGYETSAVRPKPQGFGEWWIERELDEQWYKEIYEYRAPLHAIFQKWFQTMDQSAVGPLESVIEIGCGIGYGYTSFFHNKKYLGIDLSPGFVNNCNNNNRDPNHSFFCCDILQSIPEAAADLTFSQGTIDNVYDLDAFLRAMAKITRKVIYVINYRGYFQDLASHRYRWDPQTRVCFNDLSARRAHEVLRQEGFQTVLAFPQPTQRADIPVETVIIASRERMAPELLMAHHEISSRFRSYQAKPSGWSLTQVVQAVNQGCFYFSEQGLDLANDLAYFREILATLSRSTNLCCGTVEELAIGSEKVNLALRVDVDIDLVSAAKMAWIAQEYQVPLTAYLLHTAPYYGFFQNGLFHRHEENALLYRQIQAQGGEVGLHIDPYAIYLQHGIDGAEAVKTELEWLRSKDLRIHGTSGHNAAPVYGAENFEILKGRTIRHGDWFHRNYTYLPLGVLDEAELGLRYEASMAGPAHPNQPVDETDPYLAGLPEGDFLRDYDWFRTYLVDNQYCRWGYHYNIWLLGKDMWAIGGRDHAGKLVFYFDVSWPKVAEFLTGIGPDEKVLMTLHPIYLGKRSELGAAPSDPGVMQLDKKAA